MQTVGNGRYELEAEIANGAIGTVWRGKDTRTGDRVAIKLLRREASIQPELVMAFLAEADVLAELRHPCVVRARELVRGVGQFALVLDLVNGLDLRRRLRADGPLPPAVAADVVAQIADALAYLHGRGIVHGDIKPGNILVPIDGSPVRLTDFGVARRVPADGAPDVGGRATHATPEYVAPEVVAGEAPRPSTDVYALGIVLYELLCGRSPYRGGSAAEVLRRHASCVAVPPPGLPESVWAVITGCLAKEPADRPTAPTIANRLRGLQAALDGLAPLPGIGADVVTWWPRTAEDTAPVARTRRRATWTSPKGIPVSSEPGRASSDLPIEALPNPDGSPEPPTVSAVAPVWPAALAVAPVYPAVASRGSASVASVSRAAVAVASPGVASVSRGSVAVASVSPGRASRSCAAASVASVPLAAVAVVSMSAGAAPVSPAAGIVGPASDDERTSHPAVGVAAVFPKLGEYAPADDDEPTSSVRRPRNWVVALVGSIALAALMSGVGGAMAMGVNGDGPGSSQQVEAPPQQSGGTHSSAPATKPDPTRSGTATSTPGGTVNSGFRFWIGLRFGFGWWLGQRFRFGRPRRFRWPRDGPADVHHSGAGGRWRSGHRQRDAPDTRPLTRGDLDPA